MATFDVPPYVMNSGSNDNDGMFGGGGMGFILGLLFGKGSPCSHGRNGRC